MGEVEQADVQYAKAQLREQARARRRQRSAADRDRVAQALVARGLQACAGAQVVAAYASFGTEPGTGPLRAALREAGVTVLLPVVRGEDLAWALDPGGSLVTGGERGLPEPDAALLGVGGAGLVAAGATVVLAPALVVDADGVRLGKGAGFYDRVLGSLPRGAARTLAVVHDDEVLAAGAVPASPHDLAGRVDGALTPGTGT